MKKKKKPTKPELHACWWCKSETVAVGDCVGIHNEQGCAVLCNGKCGIIGPVELTPSKAAKTWNAGPLDRT